MASGAELKSEGKQKRGATRSARRIAHRGRVARHLDFGVAHCRCVVAVHASGVGTALRIVRAMKATEPFQAAGRIQGFAECLAPRLLSTGFVEAGGNPGVSFPPVFQTFKTTQIPTPLGDSPARGENSDEPKRIHAVE